MIELTDIGGNVLYLNSDIIEKIVHNPDTVVILLTGTTLIVRETPEEVIARVVEFRRRCNDRPIITVTEATLPVETSV